MDSFNAMAITTSSWLLLASLKSLPVFAAIIFVQRQLKKQLSPGARHWLWLSFYLCLCLPIGWKLNLELPNINWHMTNAGEHISTQDTTIESKDFIFNTPISTEPEKLTQQAPEEIAAYNNKPFNWLLIFAYLWLMVFASLVVFTLWQIRRFIGIKSSAIAVSNNTQYRYEQLKSQLGIKQKIPLLQSHIVHSPVVLGLLKPAILLPQQLDQQLAPEQLIYVLRHELAHIARRDILWNWLSHWITLLHWFNPLAWYANQRMKADMEMACDAKVLSKLPREERTQYALTLIDLSQSPQLQHQLTPCVGILENHHQLKNRLLMIKESNTMTIKNLLTFGLILSALTFSALAQPNGDKTANSSNNDDKTTGNSNEAQPVFTPAFTLLDFAKQAEKNLKTQIIVGQGYSTSRFSANTSNKPLDYGQFLSQLKVNGFTAFRSQGYIQIIPIRDARNSAIPIVEPGKSYFDDEFVTEFLQLTKGCSSNYLPILRPMVPMDSHLAFYENQKMMVISDAFANVQRIKTIIARMEAGLSQIDKCEAKPAN